MKIENLKYTVSENRYSQEYLLCALCELAFKEPVTLTDVQKDGESQYVKEDRKEDITYWWFAGLKDILSLSVHENVSKYEYKLDIDKYCEMLLNYSDFLSVVETARNNRITVTSVTDDKDYYLFNKEKFDECYFTLKESGKLFDRVIEVKKFYLKCRKIGNIWTAMLNTYPVKRIVGMNISSRRQDIGADEFDYLLSRCVEFLKADGTTVLENSGFSFMTQAANILNGDKFLDKKEAKHQVLDIVNSKMKEATFVDRSTGKMQTVDSLASIDSGIEEHHFDNKQVLENFSLPDLNKSLVKISNFNNNMTTVSGKAVNMLAILDSEPNCDELLSKLYKFTNKIYGKSFLEVVESPVYGTEQTNSETAPVSGVVNGLYYSFRNVTYENILYVSHLMSKVNKNYTKYGADNGSTGLIRYNQQIYNSNACGSYPDIYQKLRDIVLEEQNIRIPRSTYFYNPYFIYVFDRASAYYDRSSLPMYKADTTNELYLPVPYAKDPSHSSISSINTVAESVKAFDDLKLYSEKTGKPLSDMYYFAKSSTGTESKNIHEKTGGLLNMQNGTNEFAKIDTVYTTSTLLKKANTGKFQLQSLILAEKMHDEREVSLDKILDKLSKVKENEADELASCTDGQRRIMVTYINNARIHEDDLISITDIFCERLTRLSAFMQGVSWKTGTAFMNYDYDELIDFKDERNSAIYNGFIRTEYLEGIFMRYNGDNMTTSISSGASQVYYLNFSNMEFLQNSTGGSSSCPELARLTNFEYMATQDFLGVSDVMLKFILPTIIDLKDGEVLNSLSLGTTYKSRKYSLIMDKYVRLGAKLAWLSLYSKEVGKAYSLDKAISNFDFESLYSKYEDTFSQLGWKKCSTSFGREVYKIIKLKSKQLGLLLAKSCMYTTDLTDLCKSLRDVVCSMLGVPDKVVTNKRNRQVSDIVYKLDFKSNPIKASINILYKDQMFRGMIDAEGTRSFICSKLESRPDLVSELNTHGFAGVEGLNEQDYNLVYSKFEEVFFMFFDSDDIPFEQKEDTLKTMGNNTQALRDFIFSNLVTTELCDIMLATFEEMGADEDLYRSLNSVNKDITDVSTGDDSNMSRYIACEYVTNLLNKVYSFMCDVAHDCHRLSTVTAVSNDADYQKLTLDRCCFYLTYRRSMMNKLLSNYERIKEEVSSPKGKYSGEDLSKLHKLLMLPESTSKLDHENPDEIIGYFCYIMRKSKNGVQQFKAYVDKVFGSNEKRVKRIAFPEFNTKSTSKFVLTSEITKRINELAYGKLFSENNKSISCIGKFSGSAIDLLKTSVKDSGLYRSVTFKDGIAMTSKGEPLILYTFNADLGNNTYSKASDKTFVYVLHEVGLFFQISLDGRVIKPLDTVASVMQISGIEYLNTVTMSNDKKSHDTDELFNSVSAKGIGISNKNLTSVRTKQLLMDTLKDLSSNLCEAQSLDLIDAKGEVLQNENTSLRVVENGTTALSTRVNIKSELKQSENKFSNVFAVLADTTDNVGIDKMSIIEDMIQKQDVISDNEASDIIDSLISCRKDSQTSIEEYHNEGMDYESAKDLVIHEFLSSKMMTIGKALDTKVDFNEVVNDIDLMYSSIVPNTVR